MAKKILILFGGILIIAILAAAAFLGGRMINANASSSGSNGGGNVKVKLTPAAELPQTNPDLAGEVKEIKDNSLTVAQAVLNSNLTEAKKPDYDSTLGKQSNMTGDTTTGPTLEVVVAKETKIYRDTTKDNLPRPKPGEDTNISMQQKLEEASLSQILAGSRVQVWGQKRGDRLIADVIIVGPPAVTSRPGGQ
jgi:hypothetical protein